MRALRAAVRQGAQADQVDDEQGADHRDRLPALGDDRQPDDRHDDTGQPEQAEVGQHPVAHRRHLGVGGPVAPATDAVAAAAAPDAFARPASTPEAVARRAAAPADAATWLSCSRRPISQATSATMAPMTVTMTMSPNRSLRTASKTPRTAVAPLPSEIDETIAFSMPRIAPRATSRATTAPAPSRTTARRRPPGEEDRADEQQDRHDDRHDDEQVEDARPRSGPPRAGRPG